MENKNKKIHLIGICGKGMSGLAIMLKEEGYTVSGSDEGFYDPVASMLVKNNISILTPHKKDNIPINTDVIIIGRHAKLTPENNEEVMAAFSSGIPIKSLPEALGDLIKEKENTVIVGSFGKSTMTALVSFALLQEQKDPSYFIGAVPLEFPANAHYGKGKDFIVEGDEYPSANWDQTSKFLHLHPTNAIFISAEHDHVNVFPSEEQYIKPYQEFVKLLPADGVLVAARGGKNVEAISKLTSATVVYYGLNEKSSWHAENISFGKVTSFDLMNGSNKIATIETILLGTHNIENIVGAAAFLLEKKLVSINTLAFAIKNFKGLSGRLDLKNEKGIPVYEGFGSSYTKARSVFDALALHFPNKKLITIFEPHTFSWRNKNQKDWYKDIFNTSAQVILLPPPTHGQETHDQMSFEEIIAEVKKHHSDVYAAHTERDALDILEKIISADSIVALVSSGSLLGLTQSAPKVASNIYPN